MMKLALCTAVVVALFYTGIAQILLLSLAAVAVATAGIW